jgi:sugar-specific transcriptional regulator TrmB
METQENPINPIPSVQKPLASPSPNTILQTEGEGKYTEIFEKVGLNKNEAQIYELLLNAGPLPMKPILFHTKLKRGNAYYHLENMAAKGLVEKIDLPKTTTKFAAKHPQNLELLLAKQKSALFSAEEELNKQLPDLRSLFQLVSIKPAVRFYEGLEGAIQVTNDSLNSKTEILTYIDNEAVNKFYPDINKQYVEQRLKKNIKKRMITIDSPYIRSRTGEYKKTAAEVRLIPAPAAFSSVMQIYDNKISYVSVDQNQKQLIGTIIEHPAIYRMHKELFEALWVKAQPLA